MKISNASILPFNLKSTQKVLVIVPHPDDEAIGCAGLLASHCAGGGEIRVVMVTDGNRRGKKLLRDQELRASLRAIGLKDTVLFRLDLPDGRLIDYHDQLQAKLDFHVEDYKPDVIIATDPADRHADHLLIGQWAWRQNCEVMTFLAHYRFWPWPFGYFPQSKLLPPPSLARQGIWKSVTLSDDARRRKQRAIEAHKSQHHIFLRPLLLSFDRQNELYRSPQ